MDRPISSFQENAVHSSPELVADPSAEPSELSGKSAFEMTFIIAVPILSVVFVFFGFARWRIRKKLRKQSKEAEDADNEHPVD